MRVSVSARTGQIALTGSSQLRVHRRECRAQSAQARVQRESGLQSSLAGAATPSPVSGVRWPPPFAAADENRTGTHSPRRALCSSCYRNVAVSGCSFCAFFSRFGGRSQALETGAAALPCGERRTVIFGTGVLVGAEGGSGHCCRSKRFVDVPR